MAVRLDLQPAASANEVDEARLVGGVRWVRVVEVLDVRYVEIAGGAGEPDSLCSAENPREFRRR